MSLSWKRELPALLLIAGLFAFAAWAWSSTPDRVPVHWGIDGRPDRYGGKFEGILLVPLIAAAVYGLMLLLPRIDPGRMNYARFSGAYYALRVGIVVFLAVLYAAMHLQYRGHGVDIARLVPLLVGALLVLIGSLMHRIRPNWFVGLRTPWTLSSNASWVRSHRLAGWVLVLGGIALGATGVTGNRSLLLVVAIGLGAGILWAVVYSYIVWRNDPERAPPPGTTTTGKNDSA